MSAETTPLEEAARALHEARGLGEIGPEEDAAQWAASLYGDDRQDAGIAVTAALAGDWLERVLDGHQETGGDAAFYTCRCGWPGHIQAAGHEYRAHVVAAIRAAAVGGVL